MVPVMGAAAAWYNDSAFLYCNDPDWLLTQKVHTKQQTYYLGRLKHVLAGTIRDTLLVFSIASTAVHGTI